MNAPPCHNGSPFSHDFVSVFVMAIGSPAESCGRLRVCRFCGVLELLWKDYRDHMPESGPVDGVIYYNPIPSQSRPEGS